MATREYTFGTQKEEACRKIAKGGYISAQDIILCLLHMECKFDCNYQHSVITATNVQGSREVKLIFTTCDFDREGYEMAYTTSDGSVLYDAVAFFCFGE